MTQKLDTLQAALQAAFGDTIKTFKRERGEITIRVAADRYLEVAGQLRDDPLLRFEQLIDLCGVDYSDCNNASLAAAGSCSRSSPRRTGR